MLAKPRLPVLSSEVLTRVSLAAAAMVPHVVALSTPFASDLTPADTWAPSFNTFCREQPYLLAYLGLYKPSQHVPNLATVFCLCLGFGCACSKYFYTGSCSLLLLIDVSTAIRHCLNSIIEGSSC